MIYLLSGEDGPAKDNKILEIKKKHIHSNEALKFDFELLYGHKLHSDDLKKAILSLPVVASRRLVIIRSAHKLSPHNIEIVSEFLDSPDERVDLVLDVIADKRKNPFLDKVQKAEVKVFHFSSKKKLNVFDMTRAMSGGSAKEALKMLQDLLREGSAPLMIMGGLVWFWGKCRVQISCSDYHKGLSFLQEADLNIKRSRLSPDCALEILIVKLTGLL